MAQSLLIIDDDPEISELITELLSYRFDKISSSLSVDDALSKLKSETYSLIFLDIKIQRRNGAEVILFLRENPANDNNTAAIILASGAINNGFIKRNSHRFAGMVIKPFDEDQILIMVNNIFSKNSASSLLEQSNVELTPKIIKTINTSNDTCPIPFPISQLELKSNKYLDQLRGNKKLKRFFYKLVIDRNPNIFVAVRVGLLINICAGVSAKLDWSSETTFEKFIHAALLHDMALAGRPDLENISSLEKLESMKEDLSKEDYKIIYEHPNIAANSLQEHKIISPDVVTIIRQHHELPGGNGFPAQIPYNKINPLSTIFIVALDLTEYIMNDLNWSIESYIKIKKDKFKGINFTKVIKAIKNMQ